jgi:hypothetical protein
MTNVVKWSGVQVAIQSALAAADTISGITKANPGVVTATAHGLNNGDYVKLLVQGMFQVDSRVFRVANKTTDTFELEGENTTSYDTFSSGTAEAITFGTTMTTAVGLQASGGDFDFIDVTTIHDNVKKQVPGTASAGVYTFDNLWDPADTALAALKAASDNQAQRCVKFRFAGGQIVTFNSYVGCTLLPTGNAQDKVTTPLTATMFGRPTVYAT